MRSKYVILFSASIVAMLAAVVSIGVWLYGKMECELRRTYRGFSENEIENVIKVREIHAFYGRQYGSVSQISNYIKIRNIKKVCLHQPYGLPEEYLSLNGLPEPDDGISYISFFIEDGLHYYAIPLDRRYHIPLSGCANPDASLLSYQCEVHNLNKICLMWRDENVRN